MSSRVERPAAPDPAPATAAATGPFALDLRGLAAFRIGIAVLLITDLVDRWLDFEAHYGADGALPRDGYLETIDTFHLSPHLWLGDAGSQLLFGLALVLALLLAAGWRTRLVTVLSWVLLCSLHSRNYMVLQSGDVALRMGLFWGMFLPLGARWSVDARSRGTPPAVAAVRTVATVALVGQLAVIYLVAATSKLAQPVWWQEGLGVHYALHVDQFTTATGVWLRDQTGLVRALDYGTLVVELLMPVLLFLPWRVSWARLVAAALIVPMHVGFMLTMEIGLFSWIMIAWWLAVLPAGVWDRVENLVARLAPHASRPRGSWRASTADPTVTVCARREEKALVGIAAVYCAWWLASANPALAMPRVVQGPLRLLRLEQRWDMFSNPPRAGGWYLAPARLADGRQIDLRTGEAIDWTRPALPSQAVGSSRWIKYLTNLEKARRQQRWYLAWLCRRWNDAHPPQARAVRVELVKMEQRTPKPGRDRPAPARMLLAAMECDQ